MMAVQDVENNLADRITHEDGKVHLHIPRLDDWMAEINPASELKQLENTGWPRGSGPTSTRPRGCATKIGWVKNSPAH